MCTRPSVAKMPPLPDYLPPDGGGRADTAFSISAVRPLAASLSSAAASSLGTLTPQRINSLRCGCWLISYRPSGNALVAYDGTMRVECHSAGRTASGDLYQRPVGFLSVSAATLAASASGPRPSPRRRRSPSRS